MTTRPSTARRFAYLTREWLHTYVYKHEKRSRTPFGFDLISGSYTANREMLTGKFEQEEVSVVREFLQSYDLFIDIGANIGFYSCIALGLGKHVIAIEPKRKNLDLLFRNLTINHWANGQCEVYPVGFSDRTGLLNLYGATGTAASLLKGWAGHSDRYSEIVPINTLDNIMRTVSTGQSIFVKIDVEGVEHSVLSGALHTLDYPGQITWLIEICLNEYHPNGDNPKYRETFDLMWLHDYKAYTADSRRILVKEEDVDSWVANKSCGLNTNNFLFIRGQHKVGVKD